MILFTLGLNFNLFADLVHKHDWETLNNYGLNMWGIASNN